ncbi:MAG: hypothetical protein WCB10_16015 [Steroidobacteraceae bacterium]
MSGMPFPPSRPLSVGEVLDLTVRIYRTTFVKCLLFASFGVIVNWVPNLYLLAKGGGVARSVLQQPHDPLYSLLMLICALVGIAFSAAIVLRQYAMLTAQPVGGEWGHAFRRLFDMILYFLLFGLILFPCILVVLPAFFVQGMTRWMLGAILLVPLCYVTVRLSLGWTVLVISRAGPVESLRRSWRLTAGAFLRLSVIFTVALLLLFVLYAVTGAVTAFLSGVLGHGDLAMVSAAVAVFTVAVGALATPFGSALGLALFGDLTVRKEGADLAQRIAAA